MEMLLMFMKQTQWCHKRRRSAALRSLCTSANHPQDQMYSWTRKLLEISMMIWRLKMPLSVNALWLINLKLKA